MHIQDYMSIQLCVNLHATSFNYLKVLEEIWCRRYILKVVRQI